MEFEYISYSEANAVSESGNDKDLQLLSIEKSQDRIDEDYNIKTPESDVSDDKQGEMNFSSIIMKHLKKIKKIIDEDQKRYEIYGDSVGYPTIIGDLFCDKSINDLDFSLNKAAQNIVELLNRYFNKIREMDNKIISLNNDRSTQYEALQQKINELNALQNNDSLLFSLDTNNRQQKMKMSHLKDEIETLNKENEDLINEKNKLKKQVREWKLKYEDSHEENVENAEKVHKLEKKIKELKKHISEQQNMGNSDNEDHSNYNVEISNLQLNLKKKDEEIEKLNSRINEKGGELNSLKQLCHKCGNSFEKDLEMGSLNSKEHYSSIETNKKSEDDSELSRLKKENEDLTQNIELKINAMNSMKKKIDDLTVSKKDLEVKCEELEELLKKSESEKQKKQETLVSMQKKFQMSRDEQNEMQSSKKLSLMLDSKENERKILQEEMEKYKKKLEEKTKECELLKKELYKSQEETNHLKKLNFKKN